MRTTAIVALLALSTLAACAKKVEETVVVSEPVSVEPTYTGKYK
ncbi:hypothetical protein [Pseudogemmobacter bohemicus]|nr:hypothetical protein [Pseudogemmobacter bohemicus]